MLGNISFQNKCEQQEKVSQVKPLLTSVTAIKRWNFDLEDCDKVLRIESTGLNTNYVESLLHTAGFSGQVLDY